MQSPFGLTHIDLCNLIIFLSMSGTESAENILLKQYADSVLEASQRFALTATRDPDEFWKRHILDALALLELVPEEMRSADLRILDLGSGNGIPGIPVAIRQPNWQVILLDSNSKKCGFLDMFCKQLSIKNVRVVAARAEVAGHDIVHRASYDIVFSRALGKLPVALELASPFLKASGMLIVPHGTSWQSELAASTKAMEELHIEFATERTYGDNFTALEFRKTGETPEKYPRSVGIPTKRPL
jgi:16S rRNA (guanine527-N7)-methyltransferase